MASMRLNGRTAIVTGAFDGIAAMTARELARAGAAEAGIHGPGSEAIAVSHPAQATVVGV